MTLDEITYDLLSIIRAGKLIDDEEIDHRQLRQWLHNQRALWIRNEINKGRSLDDNILQDVTLTMSLADTSLHSTIDSNANYLKSSTRIPPFVELHYGPAILEIKDVDLKNYSYSFVPFGQLRFSGNNRFNSKQIFATLRDGYFYIKFGSDFISIPRNSQLVVRGAYQNPTDVPGYIIDGSLASEYPLNMFMYNYIKAEILKHNLNIVLATKPDRTNDSSDQIVNNN